MRVLITGATGFLGTHLCERLIKEGITARAFLRRSSRSAHLDKLGVEKCVGAFDDIESISSALTGVDAVVHCAGGGKVKHVDEFYEANEKTTETLMQAVLLSTSRLERFVLVSSLAAAGPAPEGRPRTEADPEAPVSHYGKSKLRAEAHALAVADQIPLTILRPPAVYGPRDTRMLPLYKWASRGLVPMAALDSMTSVVYADDCVDAIFRSLTIPHESGRVYFVEEGRGYAQRELARCIGEGVGKKSRALEVPMIALRLASVCAELYGKLLSKAVVLTRDKVADISQPSWVCSSARIREELGWQAQVELAQGARITASWYRENGWL